jgi:hypothetical protein
MKHIFHLRLRILYRTLSHAGWGLMLVTTLLCSVVIIKFTSAVIDNPTYWWGFVLLFPALTWHFSRKDRNFLLISGQNMQGVLMTDYFLASIIPLGLLCFSSNWKGLGVLILGIIGLSFLPIPQKKRFESFNPALTKIPLVFFEWRCGIRQNYWMLILVYIGTLGNCVWVGGLVLSVLFLGGILASFYDFIENKDLMQHFFSQNKAYYHKLKNHLALTTVFILPHVVVYLVFNPTFWAIAFACWCFLVGLIAFSMGLKYANWYVGRQRVVLGMQHSLFVVGFLSAIFLPMSVGWMIWLNFKAHKKMLNEFA